MELHRRDSTEDNTNTLRMQRAADREAQEGPRARQGGTRSRDPPGQALQQHVCRPLSIAKLQDQGDIYQRKVEAEKRRIHELSQQLRRMHDSILVQRRASGGINAQRDSNLSTSRHITILENRLDKALVKFNEALAHNKQLRETIDNLRRERVVFDGIYRKLERELGEKKLRMAEMIDVGHASYEARDAAQSEMEVLKANADEQQLLFEREWNELSELIQKDKDMKLSIFSKEQERSQQLLSGGALQVQTQTEEEMQRLKKKLAKTHGSLDKDRGSIDASTGKVQQYEASFALIQKATGIADIEELVDVFLRAEDENFRLFNFVNALNTQIEGAEDEIERLRQQSARLQAGSEAAGGQDSVRKLLLTDLQRDHDAMQRQAVGCEAAARKAQQTLSSLDGTIHAVCQLVGCSVGDVSDGNVSELLSGVEDAVNAMVDTMDRVRRERELEQLLSNDDGQQTHAQQEERRRRRSRRLQVTRRLQLQRAQERRERQQLRQRAMRSSKQTSRQRSRRKSRRLRTTARQSQRRQQSERRLKLPLTLAVVQAVTYSRLSAAQLQQLAQFALPCCALFPVQLSACLAGSWSFVLRCPAARTPACPR